MKGQRGFTLLELAVVIAILAILTAFSSGRFRARSDDARIQRTVEDLRTLGDIAHAYWQRNPVAPPGVWDLSGGNPLAAEGLLPDGFDGTNAWGVPFMMVMSNAPPGATIITCTSAAASSINNLDPRIVTGGCLVPGLPASFGPPLGVGITRRFFHSETGFRMKLEKSLLHKQP